MPSIRQDADNDMGPTITPNTPISLSTIALVASLLVMAILGFASVSARVSVLEESAKTRDTRLERIEDKIDHLLDRAR